MAGTDIDRGAAAFSPARKVALSQTVYDALKEAILEGDLPPGTRVVEESLATQFQVSRAPLREALSQLKRDGLLTERPPRDTRVVELSDEAIRELHLVRTLLETLAYQRAARLLSPADIERLEELLNRMHEADMAGDRRLVATVDFEFHQTLYRACRLPQVIEMCDRQQVLFRLWLNVVAGAPASRTHRISDVHRSLMDAIKSQDDSAISEQVIHHVYFAGEVLTDQRSEWAKDQPRLVFPSRDKPRSRSVIRRPPALS